MMASTHNATNNKLFTLHFLENTKALDQRLLGIGYFLLDRKSVHTCIFPACQACTAFTHSWIYACSLLPSELGANTGTI